MVLPAAPWMIFNQSSLFGPFFPPGFLPGFPDLALPSQKGRNRKLGDVYLISRLGYRHCPCCLPPEDHRPQGWRNFFAGKRQAKSQHVCGETFALGARWARGIKEMGIAPHRRRMKPLDSRSLTDSQGEWSMYKTGSIFESTTSLEQGNIFRSDLKWQPTPVFLPGASHGQRGLVCYSPRGCKESDTTERFHFHFQTNSSSFPAKKPEQLLKALPWLQTMADLRDISRQDLFLGQNNGLPRVLQRMFLLIFNISPLSASDNRNTVPKMVEMQLMKVINTSRDCKFCKPWKKSCEVCLNLATRLFLCWVSSEGKILHYGLYTMSGRSAH